ERQGEVLSNRNADAAQVKKENA
ncbi:MAG TPA: NADH-quinone oxidoreductase subunit J, partial [Pantoea agglomerans]|nr:NADH-quinone oxidoreductase subunit J [Pantoea agglomerans]HAS99667.1 NADH-quinone oxidoreductase subunit J [Pantoea agglomerans]